MAATTPLQRSPRLLARLLSQPVTLLQHKNAVSTPARKRRSDSRTASETVGQPASVHPRFIVHGWLAGSWQQCRRLHAVRRI